jgi:hypothetical protein
MSGQKLQTIYLGWTAANGASTPSADNMTLQSSTATGGTGTLTYSWQKSACNGDSLTMPTISSGSTSYVWTPTILDTCANNQFGDNKYYFHVTVTDDNGCIARSANKRLNMVNPWTGAIGSSYIQLCHKVAMRGSTTYQIVQVPPSQVQTHLAHADYMANCVVFTGYKTAAPDETTEPEAIVYPNPTTGVFILELPEVKEEAHVIITDISGKLIMHKTMRKDAAPTGSFDMSNYAKGIYLIQVRDGDVNYRTKIVVQ